MLREGTPPGKLKGGERERERERQRASKVSKENVCYRSNLDLGVIYSKFKLEHQQ